MANNPNVAAMAAFGSNFAPGLITQIFTSWDKLGITIVPNCKGPTKFAKLSAGAGVQPYDPTFTGDGSFAFTDREVNPKLAKYELTIEYAKFYSTWLAYKFNAAAGSTILPFENFVWDSIVKKIKMELINGTVYKGDTADVTANKAIRICDGFKKIIPTLGLTPVATGAIVKATSIDQFDSMWDALLEEQKDAMEWNLYCAPSRKAMYNKRFRELYKIAPTYNDFGQTELESSEGKCKITPVSWLANSNMLILAPKENLILATDLESDMNTIHTIPDIWTTRAAIRFSIGLQIIDTEKIIINDQIAA